MTNKPRQKGTAGETELLRALQDEPQFKGIVRAPAGSRTDLHRPGGPFAIKLKALATRPDRGQWLITVDLADFLVMTQMTNETWEIEVKRRKTFAIHTMFEKEMVSSGISVVRTTDLSQR